MKSFYKLFMVLGASASIASLVFLVAIANHISRTLDEDDEEEAEEAEDDEEQEEEELSEDEEESSGLLDIHNSYFPQK